MIYHVDWFKFLKPGSNIFIYLIYKAIRQSHYKEVKTIIFNHNKYLIFFNIKFRKYNKMFTLTILINTNLTIDNMIKGNYNLKF